MALWHVAWTHLVVRGLGHGGRWSALRTSGCLKWGSPRVDVGLGAWALESLVVVELPFALALGRVAGGDASLRASC